MWIHYHSPSPTLQMHIIILLCPIKKGKQERVWLSQGRACALSGAWITGSRTLACKETPEDVCQNADFCVPPRSTEPESPEGAWATFLECRTGGSLLLSWWPEGSQIHQGRKAARPLWEWPQLTKLPLTPPTQYCFNNTTKQDKTDQPKYPSKNKWISKSPRGNLLQS